MPLLTRRVDASAAARSSCAWIALSIGFTLGYSLGVRQRT